VKHAALLCALCAAVAAGVARAAAAPPSGTITARVLVSPLSVSVLVPASPVKAGQDFRIRADVTNAGSTALQNVAVTLVASSALTLRDPVTQVLARVGAGVDRRARWDVCTTTAGGYVVMVRATAGPFAAGSAGELVEVTSAKRPAC
jgi:hypothetical protein